MSMEFSRLLKILLVTKLCEVELSFCIGVDGCVCPIYSRAWCDGMTSLQLMKSAPSSAFDVDDMTALMILDIFNTATLLGGNAVLFDMKKFPRALLLVFTQRGTKRCCGPLGPYHLCSILAWNMGGWPHSLIIVSPFSLCAPLGLLAVLQWTQVLSE